MSIAELNEHRLTLAARIRELADNQDEWTDADRANWAQLNADYDESRAAIDEAIEKENQAKEVVRKLEEIEKHEKAERNDRRIGLDHQERKEHDPEKIRFSTEKRAATVFQARVMYAAGFQLRQEHMDACRLYGIDLRNQGSDAADAMFGPIKPSEFDVHLPNYRRNAEPAWLCGGRVQYRDLAVSSEPEVIPEGFSNELEVAMLAFGGMRNVCRVVRTATGNDLPWPTFDDTGNAGAVLAEATTIGTSVDPTISAVTFNAWKYSSTPVLVSSELMTDSAFDLGAELGRGMGIRIGRGTHAHFTTGSGSSQPRGIITATLAGGTTTSAASATAIAADEVIDIAHDVDPSYRSMSSAGYMMHDSIVAEVRKLKGSDNNYLWTTGLQPGIPDRLYGFPVTVNQNMDAAAPASGEESILFGAFEKYIIRDAGPVRARVLTERYADTDQIAIITFSRHDGDSIQDSAFAVLQH